LVAIAIAASLSGCIFGGYRSRYSVPSVGDQRLTARRPLGSGTEEMFTVGDIAFSVQCENIRGAGILLLPLPWVIMDHPSKVRVFEVTLNLRPRLGGFVLDPTRILLSLPGSPPVAPTRIREYSSPTSSPRHWRTLPIEPLALPIGVAHVVHMEFPVPRPDPKVRFEIQIDGLRWDDAPFAMPVVQFTQGSQTGPVAAVVIPGLTI
jgi:hypothetical protein